MAKQATDQAPSLAMETVQTQLGKIPFSSIQLEPEAYGFRDEDDYSPEALKRLAEDIAANGLTTPLLVKALPDGKFLGLDCHRRYHAIKLLIGQGVAGFTPDMLVPAHVIVSDASEITLVAKAISSNVQRKAFSDEGRIRAAVRLKRLGMPEAQIARLLGVGESTVARDLDLGMDEQMMAHVRAHHIPATTAATLLKAAAKFNRLAEFKQVLGEWVDRVGQQIDAEEMVRAEQDQGSLALVERWPQRYLSAAQVRAWKEALESGNPLAEPSFRFKALLRSEKGLQRIEIDGLSKNVGEMTAADLAKVIQRCVDLVEDIKPLLAKKAEEEQTAVPLSEEQKKSPGQELLRQLGFGHLASVPDDSGPDGEAVEDGEPQPSQEPPAVTSEDPSIPSLTDAFVNRFAGGPAGG